ncbi:hypothetical protein PspCFBP13508_19680 [Pseudomonas sp. CFBP13508]|nr:hypothetical protein PspCFBP13508_19680 [Pseudomonas sp. CFBP13508]
MARSFSHYTDGARGYLTFNLKIFFGEFVAWADAFAGRPAPTFGMRSLWERACSRRGRQP